VTNNVLYYDLAEYGTITCQTKRSGAPGRYKTCSGKVQLNL